MEGSLLSRTFILRSIIRHKALKSKIKISNSNIECLQKNLEEVQSLSRLKETSQQKVQDLLCCLHSNYRETAARAQVINKMTSTLSLNKSDHNMLDHMDQIHQMSQDNSVILNRLITGFPMRAVNEKVDIVQCLKNIKTIFLSQLTEMNVQFEMRGRICSQISLDKTLFEIVLFNIFQIIIDRFIENNSFKIDLRDNSSIEIRFQDNGYDIKNRICSANHNLNIDNILFLGKDRLQNLINELGWMIIFQQKEGSLNTIILSIPKNLKDHSIIQKVINILDFKPHVK